jgi:hypothetical protein
MHSFERFVVRKDDSEPFFHRHQREAAFLYSRGIFPVIFLKAVLKTDLELKPVSICISIKAAIAAEKDNGARLFFLRDYHGKVILENSG